MSFVVVVPKELDTLSKTHWICDIEYGIFNQIERDRVLVIKDNVESGIAIWCQIEDNKVKAISKKPQPSIYKANYIGLDDEPGKIRVNIYHPLSDFFNIRIPVDIANIRRLDRVLVHERNSLFIEWNTNTVRFDIYLDIEGVLNKIDNMYVETFASSLNIRKSKERRFSNRELRLG